MKNYLKKAIILLLILFCAKTLYASALDQIIEQMSAQKTESAAKQFFGYDNTRIWLLIACAFIAWNLPKLAEEIAKEFEGAPLGGSVGKGAWSGGGKLLGGVGAVGAGLASKAKAKFGKKDGGGSAPAPSATSAGARSYPGATGQTGSNSMPGGSGPSTGPDSKNTGGNDGTPSPSGSTGIPLNNPSAGNSPSEKGGDTTPGSSSSGSNPPYPSAEDDLNEIYGATPGFMKDVLQQSKKDNANNANAAGGTKTGSDATKGAGANAANQKDQAQGAAGKDGKSKLVGGLKQTAKVVGSTAKTVGKVALTATLLTSVAGVGILAYRALNKKGEKNSSGAGALLGMGKSAAAGTPPDLKGTTPKQKPETPGSDRKDGKQEQKQPELPRRDDVREDIAKLDRKIDQLKADVDHKINNTAARLHSETISLSNQTRNAADSRVISVKADLEKTAGRAISVANDAMNKAKKGG